MVWVGNSEISWEVDWETDWEIAWETSWETFWETLSFITWEIVRLTDFPTAFPTD